MYSLSSFKYTISTQVIFFYLAKGFCAKTMPCSGSHLGIWHKNTLLVQDHQWNILSKFAVKGLVASDKNNFKHFPIGSYVKFVLWWWLSWISNWHKKKYFV